MSLILHFDTFLQTLKLHPELIVWFTLFLTFLESFVVFGSIIPGSVVMTGVGGFAGTGIVGFYPVFIAASAGCLLGDSLSFWIGRRYGGALSHRLGRFQSWLGRAEALIQRHGLLSILIGRFAGPLRAFVPALAGMSGFSFVRFFLAAALSGTLWSWLHLIPGTLLGRASQMFSPSMTRRFLILGVLLLLSLVVFIGMIYAFRQFWKKISHSFFIRLQGFSRGSSHLSLFSFLSSDPRLSSIRLALFLMGMFYGLVFLGLSVLIHHYGPDSIAWNVNVTHLAQNLRNPIFDRIMLILTFLGDKYVTTASSIFLASIYAYRRQWAAVVAWLSVGLLPVLGVHCLKDWVASPRPSGILLSPSGYSFPSGHTTLGVALFAYAGFFWRYERQPLAWPKLPVALLWLVILLPISRVYLNAHWMMDILGALGLAFALVYLILWAYQTTPEAADYLTLRRQPLPYVWILVVALFHCSFAALRLWPQWESMLEKHTLVSAQSWIAEKAWMRGKAVPPMRLNRLGRSIEPFKIEWLGSQASIEHDLERRGFKNVPVQAFESVLKHIILGDLEEQQPMLDERHEGRRPDLAFKKGDAHPFWVLRFWSSHRFLQETREPIWWVSLHSSSSGLDSALRVRQEAEALTELCQSFGDSCRRVSGIFQIRSKKSDKKEQGVLSRAQV